MSKEPGPATLYGAWYYVYGKGSHMNIAGKLILGVPMFPLIASFALIWWVLDKLFSKGQT